VPQGCGSRRAQFGGPKPLYYLSGKTGVAHFTFRVDTWTPDGESIVEHVAGVEDYQVALATFRAACQRWPGTPITLLSRRLRVVSSQ